MYDTCCTFELYMNTYSASISQFFKFLLYRGGKRREFVTTRFLIVDFPPPTISSDGSHYPASMAAQISSTKTSLIYQESSNQPTPLLPDLDEKTAKFRTISPTTGIRPRPTNQYPIGQTTVKLRHRKHHRKAASSQRPISSFIVDFAIHQLPAHHGDSRTNHRQSCPLSISLPRRPSIHQPSLSRHFLSTSHLNTDAVLPPQCPGLH